jgi:hypothetical protein
MRCMCRVLGLMRAVRGRVWRGMGLLVRCRRHLSAPSLLYDTLNVSRRLA